MIKGQCLALSTLKLHHYGGAAERRKLPSLLVQHVAIWQLSGLSGTVMLSCSQGQTRHTHPVNKSSEEMQEDTVAIRVC